jgi:quercetin dioxygenase-like cupin family protein
MRLYRFDGAVGRAISQFGSVGLTITPIARLGEGAQVIAMWIEPGGQAGAHDAVGPQLFLVIQGAGWVEGADGARTPIRAGQAAYWEDGERHAAGSSSGMGALVIEGPALDLSMLKPLATGDDENAPPPLAHEGR